MRLLEKLEATASEYFTKANALKIAIEILRENEEEKIIPIVKKKKRKGMTAKQRKEVSKRMKKYWKERRANQD